MQKPHVHVASHAPPQSNQCLFAEFSTALPRKRFPRRCMPVYRLLSFNGEDGIEKKGNKRGGKKERAARRVSDRVVYTQCVYDHFLFRVHAANKLALFMNSRNSARANTARQMDYVRTMESPVTYAARFIAVATLDTAKIPLDT